MKLSLMLYVMVFGGSVARGDPAELPGTVHVRAEYFVSPAGSPTNCGSEAMPWPSVAFAFSNINAGDIVTLLPGTYSEPVVVELSGTAERPTVIRSQRKWEAVLKGSSEHGIYVADGVSNVVIDGFQVVGAAIDGVKVGSFATVRNCWIRRSAHQGIAAHSTRGTIIEHNLVEHNGTDPTFDHGMYLSGTNLIVRGNVIRWNKTYGCQIYADPPAGSANCQVYCNLVYGNRDALTVWSPAGQTNYVFNNTLISERYVVIADYGMLCVTNNILVGDKGRMILSAEHGARIRTDYNLTPVPGKQRGSHDVIASDPGFLKPQAGLFWLRRNSPALGMAAERMRPPVDFFGRQLPKVLGVGAFQYQSRFVNDSRVLDPSPENPDYWLTNVTSRTFH
ncbi:MAG TPA: right-handed parallel beta-helix repeat-containing protein [Candidatus Paceibacterota bacterium]|nr:right-handed parallel beta-helix repeat-containing protein [Candidatus Paceibacterota bacterium]